MGTKNDMLKDGLKRICYGLGKNNDPVFAVFGIAVFKGVFRPLFTMMDKDENPQTKKYAAFREGLTEAIAFGSYLGTSFAAKALAKPLCKKFNASEELLHKTEKSLSFIAVCLCAVAIIPAVCNVTLKPIMDSVQKFQKTKKQLNETQKTNLDIKENVVPEMNVNKTSELSVLSENSKKLLLSVPKLNSVYNADMKVGG